MPCSYTYSFHALGCASVAQRQSTGFVNQWLWVQVPPLASLAGKPSSRTKAHRPIGRHKALEEPLLDRPLSRSERIVSHSAGPALGQMSLRDMDGQMAERPMASDCKSDGLSPTGVRIPLCPLIRLSRSWFSA